MNKANLTLIVPPLILLVVIVIAPITVTEDAFASYERHTGDLSQAASVSNSCLNPVSDSNTNSNMLSNGNCGGTVSQQGRSGQASTPTTVQNANPNIEVQRSTAATAQPPLTTTRGNCTACFNPLTPAQKSEYEGILQHRSIAVFGRNITTVEQLCTLLGNIVGQGRDPTEAIEAAAELFEDIQGVSSATVSNITTCLLRAVQ
jgi:hypothetical protein